MEDIIDNISEIVEDIRSELSYTDDDNLERQILEHCRHIDSKLDELKDAVYEFEEDDFRSMIPDNLSAGEAISLKETINNWRREHGYGEL